MNIGCVLSSFPLTAAWCSQHSWSRRGAGKEIGKGWSQSTRVTSYWLNLSHTAVSTGSMGNGLFEFPSLCGGWRYKGLEPYYGICHREGKQLLLEGWYWPLINLRECIIWKVQFCNRSPCFFPPQWGECFFVTMPYLVIISVKTLSSQFVVWT